MQHGKTQYPSHHIPAIPVLHSESFQRFSTSVLEDRTHPKPNADVLSFLGYPQSTSAMREKQGGTAERVTIQRSNTPDLRREVEELRREVELMRQGREEAPPLYNERLAEEESEFWLIVMSTSPSDSSRLSL